MTDNAPETPFAPDAPGLRPAQPPAQPPAGPPRAPQAGPAFYAAPPRRRRSFAGMIFMGLAGLVFMMSIVMNIYLLAALAMQMDVPFTHGTVRPGKEDQTIAVYEVSGVLGEKAASRLQRFCREVGKDGNVKAVVLRVDSPGGGVSASDQMYEAVRRLRADKGKKVVVSMGSVAASGGYYVSVAADEIIAEPTTVTGSIGVLMNWLVMKGTMDKIGLESVLMKSTNARGWKDEVSPYAKPDERQRKHLQAVLDKLQGRFEKVVRQGRAGKLREKEVTYSIRVGEGDSARTVEHTEIEPLNGKIYLPDEALAVGLIDEIGYLSAAIDRAKELAGLDKPRVIRYRRRKGFMEEILGAEVPAGVKLDAQLLDRFQTPRLLMLWKVE